MDILYENVIVGFKREFDIEDADLVDTLGVGYDYNSIMHYEPDSFGYGDSATIVSVNPNITVGGATTLSDLDVLKIGTLYSCPGVLQCHVYINSHYLILTAAIILRSCSSSIYHCYSRNTC